ncbi:MAG: hypothetical protein RIS79_1323, partial [Verrucomicrobiota bacterium]
MFPRTSLAGPAIALGALLALAVFSHAQSPTLRSELPAEELDMVTVFGESESDSITQNSFPQAVEGTKIYAGKRATVIDLDALPKVQANNYRQALASTPGLLFSEETTPL